jgi:hypothetical protein
MTPAGQVACTSADRVLRDCGRHVILDLRHPVFEVQLQAVEVLFPLLVAKPSDGNYCQTVRSDRTPTNSSCSVTAPKSSEIGVSAMNFGGAPGGILLLVGPVGSEINSLEVHYQDERVDIIPLHEGWALYEVATTDYQQGRRPQMLIGRDSSGHEVAAERLPWTQ